MERPTRAAQKKNAIQQSPQTYELARMKEKHTNNSILQTPHEIRTKTIHSNSTIRCECFIYSFRK